MIDLDDELTQARQALAKDERVADVDAELAAVQARSRRQSRVRGIGTGAAAVAVLLLVATVAVATQRSGTQALDVSTTPTSAEAPPTTAGSVPGVPTSVTTLAPDTTPPPSAAPTTVASTTTSLSPPTTTTTPLTTSLSPTTTAPTTSGAARREPPGPHPDPLPGVPAGPEMYTAWKGNVPARYTYRYMLKQLWGWRGPIDVTVDTVDGRETVVAAVDANTGVPEPDLLGELTISTLYEQIFVLFAPGEATASMATGLTVAGVPSVIEIQPTSVYALIEFSGFWVE